ncbi:hypothetical protein BJ912DRAFT_79444 [Pholiota molesta]|nr:hypothetical protein BJ912DRAFT_79444 [Pholiota molesta]
MMYPQIPQELNSEIIGFLRNDKAALKSCALTCRSFLPESQRQLFSAISLYPPTCVEGPTSSDFKRFLEAAPYLSEYVHRLEIHDLSRPDQTCDQDLISCLRYLRNLKALKVRCPQGRFDIRRWEDIRRGGLLTALLETMKLPTLTCLDFDCLPFSLVTHCPTLKHLNLRKPDPDLAVDDNMAISSFVHPESLCVDFREPSAICRKVDRRTDWAEESRKSQIDLTNLKTLSIITDAQEWEERCEAWSILKASIETLEVLSFEVEASSGMFWLNTAFQARTVIENPVGWSSLKALRVLQARITVVSAHDQWGLGFCNLLPWMFGLLRALTSSGSSDIEELVIQVNYKFLDDQMIAVLTLWKDILLHLFRRDLFPRLRNVHIMVGSESKLPAQGTVIVQQIARYARAIYNKRCPQVAVSLSTKFFDDDTSPLSMERLPVCM